MSSKYRQILRSRLDMTDWLIHFTKPQGRMTSLGVLARILAEGVLRPGFAARGASSRVTIYGPTPAVCLTEQTIDGFLRYLVARDDTKSVDGYGLLLHKHAVKRAGGLPVIYGLQGCYELRDCDEQFRPDRRLLHPECLPFAEQHRYVAFAPEEGIDWSHEREWRWPATGQTGAPEGLLYLSNLLAGGSARPSGAVHAFVRWNRERDALARRLSQEAAARRLVKISCWGKQHRILWEEQRRRLRIISLETATKELEAGRDNYARLEDWPEEDLYSLYG